MKLKRYESILAPIAAIMCMIAFEWIVCEVVFHTGQIQLFAKPSWMMALAIASIQIAALLVIFFAGVYSIIFWHMPALKTLVKLLAGITYFLWMFFYGGIVIFEVEPSALTDPELTLHGSILWIIISSIMVAGSIVVWHALFQEEFARLQQKVAAKCGEASQEKTPPAAGK